ncbi:MAG: L-threonylcarbamoyladenylate synthase [Faecalibacterium sp.]|nr:L-threonylcarbamoyladenylate synthase [Ruminococcus sp.]MCM1391209.1 L-threonylcarbamoyladenylate synthase [Ruminococcus sp.]MCM1485663.1 L-threonylcarbamoyladenylate synthase [Faecalibacterium sp.]
MKTEIFEISSTDDARLETVGKILRSGGLAAIPTETVYGLAANALDGEAVSKIYEAKGRPSDNPLIVHISNFEQWQPLVESIPENARRLAETFWPGPLTIILRKSDIIPNQVSGGLDTVAVRMPGHEIARAIIDKAGVPLAAPSANTSGKPSPTTANHVEHDLGGRIDVIVDGGDCSVGVESTVISLAVNPPRLLRPGGVTPEMLESVLGKIEIDDAVFNKLADGQQAASPGMKYKHYSPKANVVILKGSFEKYKAYVEERCNNDIALLCFDDDAEKLGDFETVTYGKSDDSSSQANRIFDALHIVDELDFKTVYARYPEVDGVGLAVFNRLVRAAGFNIIEL